MRGAAACGAAAADPVLWPDFVDFASAASCAAHAVAAAHAEPVREAATAGNLSLAIGGLRIAPGGSVAFRLVGPARAAGPRLLFLSIGTPPPEQGRLQRFTVLVDGREACRVAGADPGAGVRRTFCVAVHGESGPVLVSVRVDPDSAAPVTLAAARLTAGAPEAALAGRERIGLALLSPRGSGYALDEADLAPLVARVPVSPYLEPQAAVLFNFCARKPAESAIEIGRLASLAERAGIALRIAFQMHWAGLPIGVPDGAGGTFGDAPYQQVTFDPDDGVDDPGLRALMGDLYDVRYGLSVPNRWSNTPWLTLNHPRLNEFRRRRLQHAVAAWRDQRERLRALGKERLLPGEVSTGEETVYWAEGVDDSAYTKANGGKPRAHLLADFNPFVLVEAMRRGVRLDPRDGLDGRERWFLHQNLAHWQQSIVDWMAAALPAEPVRLSASGEPRFSEDLVRRNIFTEPYAMPVFPMRGVNDRRPGLEVGYVRGGRSGGEYWSGARMLPWLLKEREMGRIALPNLECTGADGAQLAACLRAAYACGARFATLYNWHHHADITRTLDAFSRSVDAPAGPAFAPTGTRESAGPGWSRTYTAPPDAFGVNRVDLFRADRGTEPLRVRVTVRSEGAANGPLLSATAYLPSAAGAGAASVYLPTLYPQEPGTRYRVQVELMGLGALRLAADGRLAMRVCADIRRERARSLAIGDRQDAQDIVAALALDAGVAGSRYAMAALATARDLLAEDRPLDAYRAAVRAEQIRLPAAFEVPAPGARLAPYWVTVACREAPVRASIGAYDDHVASVSLRSEVAQTVTLRWGGAEASARLTPGVTATVTLERRRGRAEAGANEGRVAGGG